MPSQAAACLKVALFGCDVQRGVAVIGDGVGVEAEAQHPSDQRRLVVGCGPAPPQGTTKTTQQTL
jgi:hypothetical protein